MRFPRIRPPARPRIFSISLSGEQLGSPSLRASDGNRRSAKWIFQACQLFPSGKGTHVGLSAAVERGPSQGARSGSTGPTWVPFPSFSSWGFREHGGPTRPPLSPLLSRYIPLRHTALLWIRSPHLPVRLSRSGTNLCWRLRRRSPPTEISTHFFETLPNAFLEWCMSISLP